MSGLFRSLRNTFGAAAISVMATSSAFAKEAGPTLMQNYGHQAPTHTAQMDIDAAPTQEIG